MKQNHCPCPYFAFTLAELLIALTLLGIIATFTIPKILESQEGAKSRAIVKEVAGTIAQAYQQYRLTNQPTATTTPAVLIPYINYIKEDTSSLVDFSNPSQQSRNCALANPHCYLLANGAIIYYFDTMNFDGTGDLNTIEIIVDPDGQYDGNGTDINSVILLLYYNGRVASRGACLDNSTNSLHPLFSSDPTWEADWFYW